LLAKLPHYKQELADRQQVSQSYTNVLHNILQTPVIKSNRSSAWAQYTVKIDNRDDMQIKLKNSSIPTAVHYPMPLHLQECFQYLKYRQGDFPIAEKASQEVLSLPINSFLTDQEIQYICQTIAS
jgi:UDP-2-acetamido-2-deoxy-ribo-hexuluronate aminotransferase